MFRTMATFLFLMALAIRMTASETYDKDCNCLPTPPACNYTDGEPSFRIELSFVDNADRPFPKELKGIVQEAADYLSRAIVRVRGTSTTSTTYSSSPSEEKAHVVDEKEVLRTYCNMNPSKERWENQKKLLEQLAEYKNVLYLCLYDGNTDFFTDKVENAFGWAVRSGTLNSNGLTVPGFGGIVLYYSDRGSPILDEDDLPQCLWCFWLSIAVHEMAHVLGFNEDLPRFQSLRGNDENFFKGGKNTKREWNKLNSTLPSPPVYQKTSHWSPHCFAEELMLPRRDFGDDYRMSTLTLAVFDDLGYEVNYACAVDVRDFYLPLTCNSDNHPTKIVSVNFGLPKALKFLFKKRRWQKRYQILRYRILTQLTKHRKRVKHLTWVIRKRCKKLCKASNQFLLQVKKSKRKFYRKCRRRIRGTVRKMIRHFSAMDNDY